MDCARGKLARGRLRIFELVASYAKRGLFPRNLERPGLRRAPCFIDPSGRDCAVAYLLRETGEAELAGRTAAEANYARVPAMHFPELDDWAARHALARGEVALIQPSYPYPYTPADLEMLRYIQVISGYAWELVALGFVGLVAAVLALACLVGGGHCGPRALPCLIVGLVLVLCVAAVHLVSAPALEEGMAIHATLTIPEHVRQYPHLYHPGAPGSEWLEMLTYLRNATLLAMVTALGCVATGGAGLIRLSIRRGKPKGRDWDAVGVGASGESG